MKNPNPSLLAEIRAQVQTWARCWEFALQDGRTLRFTRHQFPIQKGGNVYEAGSGFVDSAIKQNIKLAGDNHKIEAFFNSPQITEQDLRSGALRGAWVKTFDVNYRSPDDGEIPIDIALITRVEYRRTGWAADILNLTSMLDQEIGDLYDVTCRNKLGSPHTDAQGRPGCGIVLDPPVWQPTTAYAVLDSVKASVYDARRYVCETAGTSAASEPAWDITIGNTTTESGGVVWRTYDAYTKQGLVLSVLDQQQVLTTLIEPDNWFRGGKFTWLTGANAGITEDCKRSLNDGSFHLKFPFAKTILPGDTFSVHRGCNLLLKGPGDVAPARYTGDCVLFSPETNGNQRNFRGHPELDSALLPYRVAQ